MPTNINSSSAPLKRKITGRGGTHPESTISLATSNIDAVTVKYMIREGHNQSNEC